MIFVDYGVSSDCINIYSYGEICVKCGCCSRNKDYKDMIRRRLRYCKEMLKEEYLFKDWSEDVEMRKIQEKNISSNILYFKRKIRLYKKILKAVK